MLGPVVDLAAARRLAARERDRATAARVIADGEAQFAAAVRAAFRTVFAPVVAKFGTTVTAAADGSDAFASADDLTVIRTGWAAQVDQLLAPLVAEMFDVGTLGTLIRFADAAAARRADELADAMDEVLDRRAAAYLDAASNRLVGIGDTAWHAARENLTEGFRAGESITDLQARIGESLDVAENRAVTIARTEVVGASNAGSVAGARVLGSYGPSSKQWMATLDARTREEHADADGQTVGMDEPFDVGGEELDYPGDPAGSPGNVVNCRCTVIYPDDPTAEIDPEGRQSGYPDGTPDDLAASSTTQETTMARRTRPFTTRAGSTVAVPPPPRRAMADAPAPDAPPAPADAPTPPVPAPGDGGMPGDLTIEVPGGVNVRPFEVVLAIEGRWTGDDRYLLPGALRWDGMLPIPLTGDHVDDIASVIGLVGEVTRLTDTPNPGENLIVGRGLMDLGNADRGNDLALQTCDRIESGALRGVSVRVDDETCGGIDPSTLEPGEDEWWMYVVEDARLRALSVTPVQAFAEATITLDPEGVNLAVLPPAPTGPVAVTAEEADAIRQEIEEEIEDLIDEVGAPIIIGDGAPDTGWAVVAAGPRDDAPPASAFADPHLAAPTGVTIDEPDADGVRRVYGHLALWGSCHTGFTGQCITPPHSATGYAMFHTGEVLCSGGERVAVGRMTVGTGHASTRLTARPAAEHYDNTGAAVADVVAGEDAHGIWVAGVVRPTATELQVRTLAASPPSGDWRRIGTSMELVAALAVNSPGFPVPRARVASGVPQALVAAGYVTGDQHTRGPCLDGAAERIAASIGRDRPSLVAALAARVHGEG